MISNPNTAPRTYPVAVIPGDGIGPEVIEPAVRLLGVISERDGFEMQFTWYPWSATRYLQTGELIPVGGLDELRGYQGILFGAHGSDGVPDDVAAWGLLFAIRQGLDLYVNLRPVVSLPGIPTPVRLRSDVDLAIVRENLEGEFAGPGGLAGTGTPSEQAVQLTVITRHSTERVARFAFQLASQRRGLVTTITKSNAIRHALGYWDAIIGEVASEFPSISHEYLYVDAAAGALVQAPERFDVMLTTNLHGDILSDLAAAIVGSIAIAPSSNINPGQVSPGLFEPIHGSAPDIAGQGVANPTGALLAAAMLLDSLGETGGAERLRLALRVVIRGGNSLTPDVGGSATTQEFVQSVLDAVVDDTHLRT